MMKLLNAILLTGSIFVVASAVASPTTTEDLINTQEVKSTSHLNLDFIDIGTLEGGKESYATAAIGYDTKSGQYETMVAGHGDDRDGVTKGFYWTQKSQRIQLLGTLKDVQESYPQDINIFGKIVAGYVVMKDGTKVACHWTKKNDQQEYSLELIGPLEKGQDSYANCVSWSGDQAVGKVYNNATEVEKAFEWTIYNDNKDKVSKGVMKFLPSLNGGKDSFAMNGIWPLTSRAIIVGGATDGKDQIKKAVRWEEEENNKGYSIKLIADSGLLNNGTWAYATDIDADGSVIIGVAADGANNNVKTGFYSFLDSLMFPLPSLKDGKSSYAHRISSREQKRIVGYTAYGDDDTRRKACFWTQEDLDASVYSIQDILVKANKLPQGWELEEARDISYDGNAIAGVGKYNGIPRAWLAIIPRNVEAKPIGKQWKCALI